MGLLRHRAILFCPLVLATYFVVFWYAENANEAYLDEVIVSLAVVIAATVLMTLFLRLFVKDHAKVSALVFILLLLFFGYGILREFLLGNDLLFIDGAVISRPRYLLLIMAVPALVGISAVLIHRRNLAPLVQAVTLVTLFVVLSNIGRIIVDTRGGPESFLVDGQPYTGIEVDPEIRTGS